MNDEMKLEFCDYGYLDPPWMTDGCLYGVLTSREKSETRLEVEHVHGSRHTVILTGVWRTLLNGFIHQNVINDFLFQRLDFARMSREIDAVSRGDKTGQEYLRRTAETRALYLVTIPFSLEGGFTSICEGLRLETRKERA